MEGLRGEARKQGKRKRNAFGKERVAFRTLPSRERNRIVFQIGSSKPEYVVVQNDVAAIDLNMGCPKRFSVQDGMGIALLGNDGTGSGYRPRVCEGTRPELAICARSETEALTVKSRRCGSKRHMVHSRLRTEREKMLHSR